MINLDEKYDVRLLHGIEGEDENTNVDVVVELASGKRYGATFVTLANLRTLMETYRETGECAHGLYVWASDMIVVRTLSKAVIEATVQDLLRSGEFADAFQELQSPDADIREN